MENLYSILRSESLQNLHLGVSRILKTCVIHYLSSDKMYSNLEDLCRKQKRPMLLELSLHKAFNGKLTHSEARCDETRCIWCLLCCSDNEARLGGCFLRCSDRFIAHPTSFKSTAIVFIRSTISVEHELMVHTKRLPRIQEAEALATIIIGYGRLHPIDPTGSDRIQSIINHTTCF